MVTKNTTIIASEQNLNLVKDFFKANDLEVVVSTHRVTLVDYEYEEYIRTEQYYNAISLNYDDEHTQVVLMNMSMVNNGLNNMLIDFLTKVGASPIIMRNTFTKPVSDAETKEHFQTNVIPKLKQDLKVRYPNVPIESMIKEI